MEGGIIFRVKWILFLWEKKNLWGKLNFFYEKKNFLVEKLNFFCIKKNLSVTILKFFAWRKFFRKKSDLCGGRGDEFFLREKKFMWEIVFFLRKKSFIFEKIEFFLWKKQFFLWKKIFFCSCQRIRLKYYAWKSIKLTFYA